MDEVSSSEWQYAVDWCEMTRDVEDDSDYFYDKQKDDESEVE